MAWRPEKYRELDRVSDGVRLGTVRRCFNRHTRREYLKVKVDDGTWDRCYRFEPLLNWTEDGKRAVCVECDRDFKQSQEKELRCRTCARVEEKTEKAMERKASGDRGRTIPWRIKQQGLHG